MKGHLQELSALNIRPLRWWGQSRIDAYVTQLNAALADWCHAWGAEQDIAGADGANACETESCLGSLEEAAFQWFQAGDLSQAAGWVGMPDDLTAAIEFSLFGCASNSQSHSVASQVASCARRDLMARLAKVLQLPENLVPSAQAPSQFRKMWSGALYFWVRIADGCFVLALSPEHAGRLLKRPLATQNLPPLASVEDAIEWRFHAELEPCELALTQLRALQVGDVLCLPHRLDLPLRFRATGHRELPVWLGRAQNGRAVQIARHPEPPQPMPSSRS